MTEFLNWFQQISPKRSLTEWIADGRKAVGCLPYYAPEELVWAAGMLPMAMWGAGITADKAKTYFPPYICSLAQTSLELALQGGYGGLSAVLCAPLCDTLRALSQNWRSAVPDIPLLTYTQPQNRAAAYGKVFLTSEYRRLYRQLCAISGTEESEDALQDAIRLYNRSRQERRRFVQLAAGKGILPSHRCAVLKAAGFADPETYVAHLREFNNTLEVLPDDHSRIPVLTSGILCDHPRLLQLLDDLGFVIAADDVAAESRAFSADVPADTGDGCAALAERFAALDQDTLLSGGGCPAGFVPDRREAHLVQLAKRSGARAVLLLEQQFCDPEELLAPAAKAALERADIPCLILPTDQQTANPGQSATLLETLADLLE